MSNRNKLMYMKNNETEYFNWVDEGGLEVHKYNTDFFIYEIPQYGGTPIFVDRYTTINGALGCIDGYK